MGRIRDDSGQLMLLSGIVVTIAFILTSVTLSQVASLEREAASERSTRFPVEWRVIHERLPNSFDVAVTPDATLTSIQTTTIPLIAATYRTIELEKGFDFVLRLADSSSRFNFTEFDIHSGGSYAAWAVDGTYYFDHAFDGADDGVVWETPCPDPDGPVGACIVGLLVFVHLTDGASSMEEVMLVSVNRD